jgi:hypothetical protein
MDSLGTPPDASTQTAMAALEGFLVNNPDLERLEADDSHRLEDVETGDVCL